MRGKSPDFCVAPSKSAPMRGLAFACILIAAIAHPAAAYEAYVSNEKSNTVSVIDTDKLEVVKTIKVGQRPRGIAVSKDGKTVIVAVGDDDTIQVIDTATKQVTGTLPSGPDPELFAFDPTGKVLYVANENTNTVSVIDTVTRTPGDEIQVGVEPGGHGRQPGRQNRRLHLGNEQHGAFHRHQDA